MIPVKHNRPSACSSAIGVSGQCKSAKFMSSQLLDFSFCAVMYFWFWQIHGLAKLLPLCNLSNVAIYTH